MADVLAEAVVELEADIDKFNKDFTKSLKQAEKEAEKSTDEIDKSFKTLSGNLGKEFEQATREVARQFREQEREAKRAEREIEREAKRVARELEREARDVRRAWERELRMIERENARVQREIEAEIKRTQRAIEAENARVARENIKAQQEYEREFIASQRAMERAAAEAQQRQTESFRRHVSALRKFAAERFSLSLGVDTSQLTSALSTASKLGAVLGGIGIGALAGQASLSGIAALSVVVQDLVSAIALLPAAGAAAGIVVGTLTLGLRGLGDAISADKPEELAESLEKLSENGRKFVLAVRDMKDEFEDFTKTIQQSLLAGLDEQFTQLAKVLLPLLERNFAKIGTELRDAAVTLAAFVRQAQTLKDIERIFTNTQTSLFVFRRSLVPLAEAFRDIAAVGSDFLPIIAADLGGVAKRFGDFIAQARETDTLKFTFENAIQAVRDFFAILGNVGGIFNALLDNARMAFGNRGLLGFIRDATEGINEFFNSIQGQVKLLNFFENTARAADVVLPILKSLSAALFELVIPALVRLGEVAAPGLNILIEGLRRGLESAIPGLVSFVDSLSAVVVSLVDAGVLDALGKLVEVLGTSLGQAIRRLAPTLGNLVNSILLKLSDILPKILPALGKFADAFGNLVIAALPVVDVLADIVSKVGLPTLQKIAEELTPLIGRLASELGDVLLPILPDLADAFTEWVEVMAPIVDEVLIIFVDLLKILAPLLPAIVRSSAELAKALLPIVKLFADIIEPISKFITKLYEIPGVKKFMEEELPTILALLTGTLIVPLGKLLELIDKIVTKLEEAGIFDAFIVALTALGDALALTSDGFRRFGQFVSDTFDFLKEVARTGVDFMSQLILAGLGIIRDIFLRIWDDVKEIFSRAWEFIKSIASIGVQFLLSIITSGFNALPSIVQGALGRLRESVGDAFNRLLDIIRDLPNRILGALGSLSNLLYGVGQDLVRGFINGITSMIGSLASQAANMAKSALDAAKNALISKSPSKAMIVVGEDFGEGFIIGIDNMLRRVAEAGSDIARQTVLASTSALAPESNSIYRMNETLNRLTRNGLGPAPMPNPTATTLTGPQGDVVVTPEVHVYIGNEEIDNHITDVVDERDRRTKRSLVMGAGRLV